MTNHLKLSSEIQSRAMCWYCFLFVVFSASWSMAGQIKGLLCPCCQIAVVRVHFSLEPRGFGLMQSWWWQGLPHHQAEPHGKIFWWFPVNGKHNPACCLFGNTDSVTMVTGPVLQFPLRDGVQLLLLTQFFLLKVCGLKRAERRCVVIKSDANGC